MHAIPREKSVNEKVIRLVVYKDICYLSLQDEESTISLQGNAEKVAQSYLEDDECVETPEVWGVVVLLKTEDQFPRQWVAHRFP